MRSPIITLRDKRADRGQHAGLLLQRYLCENATGDDGDPEEKRSLLHAAISAAANTEVRLLYRGAFERWQKSLPELTAASVLQTQGRLIVGLGSENVLETGIRLHHTYGMPVIPGSALKGLAGHYCHAIFGEAARGDEAPVESQRFRRGRKEEDHEYHKLLFGATDDGGCIIFHDAWLIPDSQKSLVLDVMTPHHPKWLDGSVPPTDFDSPTPVPFLSVAGQFHVAVSWHGPVSDDAKKWTELSLSLLRDALKDVGVGGKTTSGYGRLILPPPPPPPAPAKRKTNDLVEAQLLEEKTKKGGWKAQIKGYSQSGPIQNTSDVPADKKPGDIVTLLVASINDREVAFKWPQSARK